jgi:hypothetical protein
MSKPVKTSSILHHTKPTEIKKADLIKKVEDLGGNIYGFQNFIQDKIRQHGAVIGLQSIKDFWTKERAIVSAWLFMVQSYIDFLTPKKHENE